MNKLFVPQGVNAAMITAFTEDGNINEPVVRDWVDFMINKGISGLFPVSSVGEFVHMSFQESCRLMEIVVEQAAGRVPVFPGAGAAATDISIKLAKFAERLGCPAVVVLPPYYAPVSQELIRKHFEKIARAVNIGVVLYNIPATTTPLSREIFEKLLSIPNIVAIKDSSANMVNLVHMIDLVRQNGRREFGVLTGWDDILYPALSVGSLGCISGVSGILPEIFVEIYREFQAGNMNKALELQQSVLPALRIMGSLQFPSGYKLALDIRGFESGPFRQPVDEVDRYSYLMIKKSLEESMNRLLGGRLVVRRKRIPGLI